MKITLSCNFNLNSKYKLRCSRNVSCYVMLNFTYKFQVFYVILPKKLDLPLNIILFLTVIVILDSCRCNLL